MTAPPANRVPRRQFAERGVGILAVGLASISALCGCRSRMTRDPIGRYRISGPSMNPTLWGRSRSLDCQSCGVTIRVDDSVLERAIEPVAAKTAHSSSLVCWHCGNPIAKPSLRAAMQSPASPPDLIDVAACATGDLDGGDILLIRKNGRHVKRLLAKPGQTVSVDDSGRLLVEGGRPSFSSPPRVAVDRDRLRTSSRWRGMGETSGWQRRPDRIWTARGDTDWLVYEHQRVYRGAGPGRVLDDYPGNLGIQRSLFPADVLSIQFEWEPSPRPPHADIECEFAFWTDRGIELQWQTVTLGSGIPVQATAGRTLPTDPQWREQPARLVLPPDLLSPQRPIGVRFSTSHDGSVEVRNLSVNRDVLYRTNPTAPPSGKSDKYLPPKFPLHLGDDEWFVVGDNVPLSIDSRYWGPVRTAEILGRVDTIDKALSSGVES